MDASMHLHYLREHASLDIDPPMGRISFGYLWFTLLAGDAIYMLLHMAITVTRQGRSTDLANDVCFLQPLALENVARAAEDKRLLCSFTPLLFCCGMPPCCLFSCRIGSTSTLNWTEGYTKLRRRTTPRYEQLYRPGMAG